MTNLSVQEIYWTCVIDGSSARTRGERKQRKRNRNSFHG